MEAVQRSNLFVVPLDRQGEWFRYPVYPGERVWTNPLPGGRYDFILDGAMFHDARIYMHFYATGITPAMAAKNVGVGS